MIAKMKAVIAKIAKARVFVDVILCSLFVAVKVTLIFTSNGNQTRVLL